MLNDLLVIGTGISGLTFAIKVAERNPKLNITIISKGNINEGNTRYAQGGIAVVRNLKDDSIDMFGIQLLQVMVNVIVVLLNLLLKKLIQDLMS